MFEQNQAVIGCAEQIAATGTVKEVLAELRKLCLIDFGYLFISLPNANWPNLSRVLPQMAADDVQKSWAGECGPRLLLSTAHFMEIVHRHFVEIRHRTISRAKVLDYGCGYGRVIRLLYYFTDPENIFGLDPWDKSIEICQQDRLLGSFQQIDYLPTHLPVPENHFDLICSYSVFSHTSMKVTLQALRTLRRYVAPSGMLVLTTRPTEFWRIDSYKDRPGFDLERQLAEHRGTGYSFLPSGWNLPADGESIFGDTSIDPDWFVRNFPEWTLHAYDRGMDNYQVILFLTPT